VTGSCQYRFTATELYQRTAPGTAPESHCGARVFAMRDEPEVVPQTVRAPDGELMTAFVKTGRMLPREHPDPHCPEHGGTPEPEPDPSFDLAQLEAAHAAYLQVASQYQQDHGVILQPVIEPAALAAAPAPAPRHAAIEAGGPDVQ
jgi:hypothetical protein